MEPRGYIKRVKLENFMCHQLFELELHPCTNIIIGKNGSGKSAILTALIIGLGGRASSTARADRLADLIRHGAEASYITIVFHVPQSLKFLLAKYGDEIIVERRFTASTTSLRIKNKNGRTVSTKVKDLQLLARFYGIHPTNPLALLTQDAAKEFLIHASPKLKYSRLEEAVHFVTIRAYLESAERLLADIAANVASAQLLLETTQRSLDNQNQILNDAQAGQNAADELAKTRSILAWRKVLNCRKDVSQLEDNIRDSQLHFDGLASEAERLINLVNELQLETQQLKEELDKSAIEQMKKRVKISEVQMSVEKARTRISHCQGDCRLLNMMIEQQGAKIAKLQQDASGRDPEAVKKRREHLKREIEQVEKRISDLTDLRAELTSKSEELYSEFNRRSMAVKRAEAQLADHQKERRSLETQMRQQHQTVQTDFLQGYHSSIRQLELKIANCNWNRPPKGPLGKYVTLTDPKWSSILESVLQPAILCYWVTNEEDRRTLQLLAQSVNARISIIVAYTDTFEVESIMPQRDSRFVRVLDILQFSDLDICRLFVDLLDIHSMVLAHDTVTALDISDPATKPPKVGFVYVPASKRGTYLRFGSKLANVRERTQFNLWRGNPRIQVRDVDAQVHLANLLKVSELEENELKCALEQARATRNSAKNSLESIRLQLDDTRRQNADFRQALSENRATLGRIADGDANIGEKIRREENILADYCWQKENFSQQRRDAELREALKDLDEAKDIYQNAEENKRNLLTRKETLRNQKIQYEQLIYKLDVERTQKQLSIEQLRKILESTQQELANLETAARLLGPQIENEQSDLALERRAFELENHIARVNSNQEDMHKIKKQVNELKTLVQHRRAQSQEAASLLVGQKRRTEERRRNFEEIRENCFQTMPKDYQRILASRGFQGHLILDKLKKTLTADASPDGSATRNAATLSGGEKSFAQMAVLMTVWRQMDRSFVALDEYDVFMDKQARTHSLDILLGTVIEKQHQCLLITPQDIESDRLAHYPNQIRTHRLKAPRGSQDNPKNIFFSDDPGNQSNNS